jgi:tetratricopeptide (TPR) repeat protein
VTRFLPIFLLLVAFPAGIRGAEPAVAVRLRDTTWFVGQSVPFYVQVTGIRDASVPVLAPSPDFEIRHVATAPAVQDGHRRLVSTFEALPLRAGSLRLPAGSVEAAGRRLEFPETPVAVKEPAATDAMRLDASFALAECYVGQAVPLTVAWTSALSFNGIRAVNLHVPAFRSALFKTHAPFPDTDPADDGAIGLPVAGERVIARFADASLQAQPAVRIAFGRVLVPVRASDHELLLPPATLLCSYAEPRDRRFKGSRYPSYFNNDFFEDDPAGAFDRFLIRSEPLRLRVLPLPEEGRPPDFSGLVGAFAVAAEAEPAAVSVGQALVLRLRVSGHPFPRLLDLPARLADGPLARLFALPDTPVRPLAQGTDLVWSIPVRPLHEGVAAVPALEFPFFDPVSRSYGHARTAPIPLQVKPAEAVAAAEAVFADGTRLRNEVEPAAGGIFHHVVGPVVQETRHPGGWTWPASAWFLLFGLPPLGFLAAARLSRGRRWARSAPELARRELAFARLRRALRRLREPLDPHAAALAVRRYFQDRFDLPGTAAAVDFHALAERLGVDPAAASALTDWLAAAESAAFAPASAPGDPSEVGRVSLVRLVGGFEKTSCRRRPGPARLLVALGFACAAASSSASPDLARAEAEAFFVRAHEVAPADPAAAARFYRLAAERYETLLDEHGLGPNGWVHYNLGNAFYLAGDIGRAILHYRRAEPWLRGEPRLRLALEHVRAERLDVFPRSVSTPLWRRVFFWHFAWSDQARRQVLGATWAFAWFLAAVRLFGPRPVLRRGFVLAAAAAVLLLGSGWIHARAFRRDDAVVLAREVIARKGDASVYAPAFTAPLHAGAEVVIREERRDWLRVAVEDGSEGWIPAATATRVRPGVR